MPNPTTQVSGPPVVSVIIPTRNCLRWLPRAIESIGPRPDVEIIVLDDGSSDGSREWLAQETLRDPRLVVLHGNGMGPSRARNQALSAVRAPLVAFLDADDWWYPGKLETQLALHQANPEVAFSFTDYRHITEDGDDRGGCFAYWPRFLARIRGRTEPFSLGADGLPQLFAENVVGTSTVMARTDLLRRANGFSVELPSSEDWDLWLQLARRGPVMCVPQVMMDYLMHRPGNVSGKLLTRVLSLRMIGARHQAAVQRIDRSAMRGFTARVMEAEAEIAQVAGEPWHDLGYRLVALSNMPSRRALREALGAARRALRRRPKPARGGMARLSA